MTAAGTVPEAAVALLLAAAMAVGGGLNLVGPAFIREEFARWGYPAPLRVVVGLAEWTPPACSFRP